MRKCGYCRKAFQPTTPEQLYCRRKCRIAARKVREAKRNLDVSVSERKNCHCGRPIHHHTDITFDDGTPFTRELCKECDAARCDAFPLDCPFDKAVPDRGRVLKRNA